VAVSLRAMTGVPAAIPAGWAGLPRTPLALLPTPLHPAPALARALGVDERLWLKRDDLTGFAAAGNKARSLELLVADAIARGADTLVTGGSPASNFIAAAAAGAAVRGLGCELVVAGGPDERPPATLATAIRAGARVSWTGSHDRSGLDGAIRARADALDASGARCYPMPRGGSNGLGAVGFALAAAELAAQGPGDGVGRAGRLGVVVAVGSGGTLAGLLAGVAALGLDWDLLGVVVSRPVAETEQQVRRVAAECLALVGSIAPLPAFRLVDGRGPGHAVASAAGRAAAGLALRHAGLLLDPTYTAKALAALASAGLPGPVVFWHTGGTFAALDDQLAEESG
jgi:1-aminocyclopropane-1-carboxylate deaminase/D-cysteine desulfhydrase-like pyridoxal-dependent ACC family enzyme